APGDLPRPAGVPRPPTGLRCLRPRSRLSGLRHRTYGPGRGGRAGEGPPSGRDRRVGAVDVIGRRIIAALLPAVPVGVGACGGTGPAGSGGTTGAPPFRSCPVAGSASPAAPPSAGGGRALPSVPLPCFAGGADVDLSTIGRPAVINFWSSSCGPCRRE